MTNSIVMLDFVVITRTDLVQELLWKRKWMSSAPSRLNPISKAWKHRSILNIQLANNKKKVWSQLPIVNSDYLSQAKSKEEAWSQDSSDTFLSVLTYLFQFILSYLQSFVIKLINSLSILCYNLETFFLHRDHGSLYWMAPIVKKKSDHSENNQPSLFPSSGFCSDNGPPRRQI